jgi:hypothetical protein
MALKLKIFINGETYNIETDNLKMISKDVILKLFERELLRCRNKTDAVLNISPLLDLSESTVWTAIDNGT